jgi:hypothetical protein
LGKFTYLQSTKTENVGTGSNFFSERYFFNYSFNYSLLRALAVMTIDIPSTMTADGVAEMTAFYTVGGIGSATNPPFGGSRKGYFTLAGVSDSTRQVTIEFTKDPLFIPPTNQMLLTLQGPSWLSPSASSDYCIMVVENVA